MFNKTKYRILSTPIPRPSTNLFLFFFLSTPHTDTHIETAHTTPETRDIRVLANSHVKQHMSRLIDGIFNFNTKQLSFHSWPIHPQSNYKYLFVCIYKYLFICMFNRSIKRFILRNWNVVDLCVTSGCLWVKCNKFKNSILDFNLIRKFDCIAKNDNSQKQTNILDLSITIIQCKRRRPMRHKQYIQFMIETNETTWEDIENRETKIK